MVENFKSTVFKPFLWEILVFYAIIYWFINYKDTFYIIESKNLERGAIVKVIGITGKSGS